MSNIFFTADDHFGNKNILINSERPFQTIEEHDEYLISRWNNQVSRKDTTIIVGDFAWKNHLTYLNRLNGKKILIIGSHDKMPKSSLSQFSEVHTLLFRKFNGTYYYITHCPSLSWEQKHYKSVHLHGHSHGRNQEFSDLRRMDVGVDVSPDYSPFPLEFIEYKMSLKTDPEYPEDEDKNKIAKENKIKNIQLIIRKALESSWIPSVGLPNKCSVCQTEHFKGCMCPNCFGGNHGNKSR